MKAFFTLGFFLLAASSIFAQQNKWMKDEKNILTVTITKSATQSELRELKALLWETYKIRFDMEHIEFSKNQKRLKSLGLRIELPTGDVGTVSTTFIKPGQVIGFHFDRNEEAYDVFGVWAK